ncbi:hypothetical protein ACQKIW_31615 [Bacillus thuringiensis]|uniref:hypothetical protein n=1 Tax=Bacillus thuringiensis TaxID=1428 RepID=UPI003D0407AA
MAFRDVVLARDINIDSLQMYYGKGQQTVNAPYPQVPADPYQPWPDSGMDVSQPAIQTQQFINIPIVSTRTISKDDWFQLAVQIIFTFEKMFGLNSSNILYTYDATEIEPKTPEGLLRLLNAFPGGNSSLIPRGITVAYFALPTNVSQNQQYINGSTLIRTTKYKLLSNDTADRNIGYHWEHEVTSGITESFSHTIAATLGFSMSFTEGGFPLPAKAEQEISASLTYTFGYSNSYSNAETTKQVFDFHIPGRDYQYSIYKAGVYQLNSTYNFTPSQSLTNLVNQITASFANLGTGFQKYNGYFIADLSTAYNYQDKSLYATQTPDPTPNVDKEHVVQYVLFNNLLKPLIPPNPPCVCPSPSTNESMDQAAILAQLEQMNQQNNL